MTMSQRPLGSAVEETVDLGESAVAWPAIFGGALATLGITLAAIPLGLALGLAFAPPWHGFGEEAKAMTLLGVIWMIVVQWFSSGVGGYLTGRLRSAIAGAHTHEVFFRDTVHGFLAWVLALVVTVILAGSIGDFGMRMSHGPAGGPAMSWSPEGRAAEKLLRGDPGTDAKGTELGRQQVTSILMAGGPTEQLTDEDRAELTQIITLRAGVSETEASARIDRASASLKEIKLARHKALISTSISLFLSLWIGALISTAAAALGGQHRDAHFSTGSLR